MKSLLPSPRPIGKIVTRHLAAMDEWDALRTIYRKVKESEKTKADQITQAWKAEADAKNDEQQAARAREDEAEAEKRQADQEALLASLPDEPPPPNRADDPFYFDLRDLLSEDE